MPPPGPTRKAAPAAAGQRGAAEPGVRETERAVTAISAITEQGRSAAAGCVTQNGAVITADGHTGYRHDAEV